MQRAILSWVLSILTFCTLVEPRSARAEIDPALLSRFREEAPAGWDRIEAVHATANFRGVLSDLLEEAGRGEIEYKDHGLGILCRKKPGFLLVETSRIKIDRPGSRGGSASIISPSGTFTAYRAKPDDNAWVAGSVEQGHDAAARLQYSLLSQLGGYLVPFRFHPLLTNREFFVEDGAVLIGLATEGENPHLVRATFRFTNTEDPEKKALFGVAIFDATRDWELLEADVRSAKSSVHRDVQYRTDQKSGIRTFAAVRRKLTTPAAVNRLTFTVTEFGAPPRDADFEATAYSCAETAQRNSDGDDPNAPSPKSKTWWMVLSIVSGMLIGIVFLVRRYRSMFAMVQIPPKRIVSTSRLPSSVASPSPMLDRMPATRQPH